LTSIFLGTHLSDEDFSNHPAITLFGYTVGSGVAGAFGQAAADPVAVPGAELRMSRYRTVTSIELRLHLRCSLLCSAI
jgi:hypothetical protein